MAEHARDWPTPGPFRRSGLVEGAQAGDGKPIPERAHSLEALCREVHTTVREPDSGIPGAPGDGSDDLPCGFIALHATGRKLLAARPSQTKIRASPRNGASLNPGPLLPGSKKPSSSVERLSTSVHRPPMLPEVLAKSSRTSRSAHVPWP